MPPEEHAPLVAELFKSAAEIDPERRRSFLDEQCGSNAKLRAELESLLRAQDRAGQFMERSAADVVARNFTREGALGAGQIVGGYEIVSLIGKGGMGEVYLAQDYRLRRQVALKLVRGGIDRETMARRFQREQELLAGLNHPNIAQLYDTGVTEDGIPYFAMEYVKGSRLDQFVDQQALGLNERLTLFRKLCAAVAYAHQNLVIHRDIKPANIRVTPSGEPKLLDFGIARLLDEMAADPAEQTVTMERMLTPDYASPEQVRGERITTATDVYSLGIVLYELLTGTKPYRLTSRRPEEITRAITEQTPARPSSIAGANARSLRGDLDNIVLMAMRKEPERRYPSAAHLGADIDRHLQGLPVAARKDTWGYRSSKFIRRNRVAVAAAAVVLVSTLAGLVFALRSADQARSQRDLARREKSKAERINQFLQTMLSFSNQSITSVAPVPQRKDVTVNEMLDQIVPQVESELADAPEVRAQVLRTIGSAYASQGQYKSAEKHLRAALEAQSHLYGEQSEEAASTMIELGVLLFRRFTLEEAGELLDKAVAYYRKRRGTDLSVATAIKLILALDYLATVKLYQGDVVGTQALSEEALRITSGVNLQGHERGVLALTKGVFGALLVNLGELEKADAALRESLSEYRQISPHASWEEGATAGYLGAVALARNQIEEAEKLILEGERILKQTLGEQNEYVAACLNRKASLWLRKGDFKAAEGQALESLRMMQESLPDKRLMWAVPMQTLGTILTQNTRAPEGENYYRQALAILQDQPTRNYLFITQLKIHLSQSLLAQDRSAEAEHMASEARDDARQHLGDQSPITKAAIGNLASIQQKHGRAPADGPKRPEL